jgi:hypothetical protein
VEHLNVALLAPEMIHRDVVSRIRVPWVRFGAGSGRPVIGEDVWLSNGVSQAGPRIRCRHFKDGAELLKRA